MNDYPTTTVVAYPPPHIIKYWKERGDSLTAISKRTITKPIMIYDRGSKTVKIPTRNHRLLTYRYSQICEAITDYWQEHGYGPTYKELCQACDLSMGNLTYHLGRMRLRGMVMWEDRKSRTLRVGETRCGRGGGLTNALL